MSQILTGKSHNTTPEETQRSVVTKRAERKGRKSVEKNYATLERLNIEYEKIDKIFPNEWNPNRQSEHDFELLLRSMEEDGFTQPVIVNLEGKIVDGEHRWRAAKALSFEEIPVVRVDMNDEQMRISTIRHNRARGTHDVDLEAEILRDLQKMGALEWAQDSLMIDDVEINRLLEDVSAAEALAGEDYSEAWIPDSVTEQDKEAIQQTSMQANVRTSADGGQTVQAMTAAAIDQQRRREEAIKNAKTEQERAWVKRDTRIYRVSLIFSGDESEIVKEAMGDEPANMLLTWCKQAIGPERLKEIEEATSEKAVDA